MSALILPRADTAMMNLFLAQVSADFQGHFAIMLVDQAGWHMAKALAVPDNLRLLPLPPRSPELNPVEHVWDDLREKHFHNLAFASLDAVEAALCKGLSQLMAEPAKVRSMTDFPYMRLTH